MKDAAEKIIFKIKRTQTAIEHYSQVLSDVWTFPSEPMPVKARKMWQSHLKALKRRRDRQLSINGQLFHFCSVWDLNRRIWNVQQLLERASDELAVDGQRAKAGL